MSKYSAKFELTVDLPQRHEEDFDKIWDEQGPEVIQQAMLLATEIALPEMAAILGAESEDDIICEVSFFRKEDD